MLTLYSDVMTMSYLFSTGFFIDLIPPMAQPSSKASRGQPAEVKKH